MRACVLVVDDHAVLAELLTGALRHAGHDAVTGGPASLDDDALVELASTRAASVVVLDLVLGAGRSGLSLIPRFVERGTAVVVLTASDDPSVHRAAVTAGATAVLDKLAPLEDALAAVEAALPRSDTVGRTPLHVLSGRERQVLARLVCGRAAKDIATELGVALPTVRTQIRSLHRKLGVNSQREAIIVAARAGWLLTE